MIVNFRYNSSWEEFEKSVKILKKLLAQNQAYWMIGYMRDLDIYIDESAEEELQDDISNIIHEEILYLLYSLLESEAIDENEIKEALTDMNREMPEEELQETITSVRNKFELVKDAFDLEQLAVRNNLKKETVNAKLCDFEYNIYSTKLSDGKKTKCAIINLSSKKSLKSIKGNPLNFFLQNDGQSNEISFLCDKEDLDLLIHQLSTIRKKVEEY